MNINVNIKSEQPLKIMNMVRETVYPSGMRRLGAPWKYTLENVVEAFLFRLKTALPLRLIAALFFIQLTTLFRHCRRLTMLLATLHEREKPAHEVDHLIVDTTSTRAKTGDVKFYSGYKKQRVVKVQVLCCNEGLVRHVSNGHPGSIHDKRIWNLEFPGIPRHHAILADRAYAGATGDGSFLHRPVRKNETAYKADMPKAKEQNRRLSLKRVKIEHLFARLKTWRIIHHYFPQNPETYSTVFKAIAYIHNQMVLERLSEL